MKTYAEEEGVEPFNWHAFLELAIEDAITGQESLDAIDEAEDWVTCACGNQCALIPRDPNHGSPLDEKLRELGVNFMLAIGSCDYQGAKIILTRIEQRSSEILTAMGLQQ